MTTPRVSIVFEGESDRAMATKVIRYSGLGIDKVLSKGGASRVDKLIPKLAKNTRLWNPWVVFRDSDTECPVELRRKLIGPISPNPAFTLRIVHPMSEGWLMADQQSFSQYFEIPEKKLPTDTESLPHAKRFLLDLCGKYSSRDICSDIVRSDGSTGPLYAFRINDFARNHWDIESAARNSPSLNRALVSLERMRSFLLSKDEKSSS